VDLTSTGDHPAGANQVHANDGRGEEFRTTSALMVQDPYKSPPRLALHDERPALRAHRAGVHPARRVDLGDLQRGAAVLSHRRRLRLAGAPILNFIFR
jgi:hypothetical protein